MADKSWPQWRVPLHPEDAATYRQQYGDMQAQSERLRELAFQSEMRRLETIAAAKRHAESQMRRAGAPVDQEAALQFGAKAANAIGATGEPLGLLAARGLADVQEWAYSQPESRNVFAQVAYAPASAGLQMAKAFSSPEAGGPNTPGEFASQVAWALPSALAPEMGYPIAPAEEELSRYIGDNPVTAGVVLPKINDYGFVDPVKRVGMAAASQAMDAAGDAVRRIAPSSSDRFQALLKARRQFDVRPLPESGTFADIASGAIDGLRRDGFYIPEAVAGKFGAQRPTAFYDASLPNARAVRRHESMHGVYRSAMKDPGLRAAVPLWAQARGGPFEEELLARLASRDPGAVLDWQTGPYRKQDQIAYSVAGPLLAAARLVRDRPKTVGASAVTLGGLGYGVLGAAE